MTTIAPLDVDLWISDEELAQLADNLERIVSRSRPRPAPERPAFFTDYLEVE